MIMNAKPVNVLVVAPLDASDLHPVTAHLVGAANLLAAGLGGAVHLLLMGSCSESTLIKAATLAGVAEVVVTKGDQVAVINAETLALQIAEVGVAYARIVGVHNLMARAAFPRAAAMRGAAYLSDVVRIAGVELERPTYAGAALTLVEPLGQTFMTIRPSAFPAASTTAAPAPIRSIPAVNADSRTRMTGREVGGQGRPDLGQARIVVAGGRGVGSAENMRKVEAFADHLGAAVGASRAAVDAGFASNAVQIGQTGKTIAPDLYIAMGISGAIQHLAGIKDAKCIVAINKDPDAPIFQFADFGIVGDLFDVFQLLQAQLPEGSHA